ncbi:MAG TPA: cadmium resistance transporter [Azospirillaceae bacterium]|nr:cadmium resistance transporter [Azospirillaceae bacterium]
MTDGDWAGILGAGALAIAATDVDDLLLLTAFFANPRWRPGAVVAGQMLGILVLVVAGLAAARLLLVFPAPWVGLLGFVPIVIGVRELVEDDEEDGVSESVQGAPSVHPALAVAAVTIANGADNIGVYVPLFTAQGPSASVALAAVFLALAGAWCWLAWRIATHPRIAAPVRRWLPRFMPWALMAAGVYVLLAMGTPSLVF